MRLLEFEEALKAIGINLNDNQKKQYQIYIKMLQEWNEKINLTAITDEESIYSLHFYDSIVPFAKSGITFNNICDVGAGAGFPSIPLKIAYPSLQVTIVEPLNKRCNFLKELVNALELENVTIVNARAEDYVKDNRESFDVVSARAVANLNILSELCIPLVKIGGYFVALKGSAGLDEKEHANKAIEILGASFEKAYTEIIDEHTHINLVYKKIKATPSKYPRMYAKIKKSPL